MTRLGCILVLTFCALVADSRGFVYGTLAIYTSTSSPPSTLRRTTRAVVSARDDIVFPSDIVQRSAVKSNNNNPPQILPARTTSDPWAGLDLPTADPWTNMFPRQETTSRSSQDQSIHFIDTDDLPVHLLPGVRPTPPPTRRGGGSRTTPSTAATEEPDCDCPTTPEFNPVCGEVATQRVTFPNKSYLKCADLCGPERIKLLFHNSCRRILNVLRPLPTRS